MDTIKVGGGCQAKAKVLSSIPFRGAFALAAGGYFLTRYLSMLDKVSSHFPRSPFTHPSSPTLARILSLSLCFFSLLYSFFPSSSLLPFLVLQLCLARRISLLCFSSLLTRNHYQLRLSGRILHFRRFLYCGRPRRPSKQTAKGPFSTLSGFVRAHLSKKFNPRPFSFPFHFDRSMGQMRMEQVVEFDFRRMIFVPLEIVTRRRFNNSTEINV